MKRRGFLMTFLFGNRVFRHYPWVYFPIGLMLTFGGLAFLPANEATSTPWQVALGAAVSFSGIFLLGYAKYVQYRKLRAEGVPLEEFIFYRRFKGLPCDDALD